MKNLSIFMMLFAFVFGYTQPSTNAPTPTLAPSNVISVFSDTYNNVATNYNPNWGQSGTVNPTFEAVPGSGNDVLAYTNFNYQGTELNKQDVSLMEYLHVDVWVPAGTSRLLKISPINNGSGAGEFLVVVPLTPGSWNSVDLPKSSFTGMTWNSVFQMKFDGQFNADGSANTSGWDVYLDNIYFWKPLSTQDATLSDLRVSGTTISGFSSGTLSYTYDVQPGTTSIPTVTATATQSSSNVSVTQASSIPGEASVLVTAEDGTTTKTYKVQFVEIAAPLTAAPTPPGRAPSDVISIFSDTYANISSTKNPFGDAKITDLTIAGNNTTRLTFTNPGSGYQYITESKDLSDFSNMHIDVWVAGPTEPGQVIQLIVQNFNEDGSFSNNLIYNIDLATAGTGNWYSADILFTDFTAGNRNNIKQFQVVGAGPSAFGPTYIDNIYFHNNKLSVSVTNKATLRFYPNPVTSGENIYVSAKVQSLDIYNLTGQKVKSSTTQNISSTGLAKGLYILKAISENGKTTSSKLIVK
ncbi:T9SS type A sorting domain-containing protein [Epilithonimonas mollis]|uniref:Por secretion system C-terminal sorting domain-containing protein n=1 Tax=Epilithonimonas mollis TaxID=216903 RepID=A0A1M6SMH5_9FLAO|nr:T9SS type A sorting domain-containing protein [Epilithonimonas mollis]SHK45984.1 Por secretion system C-terminal sorting domain-containing protein [Epilithonimonas mollis]